MIDTGHGFAAYVGQSSNIYSRLQHHESGISNKPESIHQKFVAKNRAAGREDFFILLTTIGLRRSEISETLSEDLRILKLWACLMFKSLVPRSSTEWLPVSLQGEFLSADSGVPYLNTQSPLVNIARPLGELPGDKTQGTAKCSTKEKWADAHKPTGMKVALSYSSRLEAKTTAQITIIFCGTRIGANVKGPAVPNLDRDSLRTIFDFEPGPGPHLHLYARRALPTDPAYKLGIRLTGTNRRRTISDVVVQQWPKYLEPRQRLLQVVRRPRLRTGEFRHGAHDRRRHGAHARRRHGVYVWRRGRGLRLGMRT